MEKTYTQPTSCEIAIKGIPADGHADAFSYNPSGSDARALGHLFIVGNVSHETDDMAYVINLISALAKREYYSRPDIQPREAFTATLKKINEVVEEFFKNNGLTLNVGIFAVAGNQILISKLGKFKVILARDQRTIDVLNNVDLFNKELTQEKQFSNIISGKISDQDRLFAFYPSKMVVARERFIKDYFLKLAREDFIEKLNTIKKEKDTFGCAALYITFQKVTEQAEEVRPTPREMAQAAILATEPTPTLAQRKVRGAVVPPSPSPTPIATHNEAPTPAVTVASVGEMPRIIPSEFSLGTKINPIALFIKRLRLPGLSRRSKLFLYGIGIVALIGVAFTVKNTLIQSDTEREAQIKIQEVQTALRDAQAKISGNDLMGARQLLASSLATIALLGISDQTTQVTTELMQALDTVDKAEDVATQLVVEVPQDTGQAMLVALAGANPILFASKESKSQTLLVEQNAITRTVQVENVTPTKFLSGKDSASLLDVQGRVLATVRNDKMTSATLGITEPLNAGTLYEDNLYAIAGQSIKKIADAAQGSTKASDWLKSGTIEGDVVDIAVDGDVFILTTDGKLATYFRGELKGSTQLPLSPTADMRLVTAGENPNLYLVNRAMGRVYLIDKKLGSIIRTLKLGVQNISDATVDEAGTVYFLKDNKLWKTQ